MSTIQNRLQTVIRSDAFKTVIDVLSAVGRIALVGSAAVVYSMFGLSRPG